MDNELIDIDEELDVEEEEAESISATDGFMEHMEHTLNEDILARQGVKIVGKKFVFTGLDGKEYDLSFKMKLFAEKYLEFKGSGVNAVISAGYDVRKKDDKGEPINDVYNRKLAAVIARENLQKPNICAYISKLYERYGFSDEAVEREHLFLINQQEDKKTKKAAIDMYYKLKSKYPAEKHDITSKGEKVLGIRMIVPDGAKIDTEE